MGGSGVEAPGLEVRARGRVAAPRAGSARPGGGWGAALWQPGGQAGAVGGSEAVESLLTGDRSEAIPLHSNHLLDNFRALEELKADDQEAIIRLLDAMILKNKVQTTLDLSEARTAAG